MFVAHAVFALGPDLLSLLFFFLFLLLLFLLLFFLFRLLLFFLFLFFLFLFLFFFFFGIASGSASSRVSMLLGSIMSVFSISTSSLSSSFPAESEMRANPTNKKRTNLFMVLVLLFGLRSKLISHVLLR